MGLLPTTLTFNDTPLSIIDRHGEPWVTAADLGRALGYGRGQGGAQTDAPFETEASKHIRRLYNRHADEFTEEMTALVDMETAGGRQKVRIFSPRGCHLIAMFARTDRAKAFRRWVLDVLETHTRGAGPECRLTPLLALTRGRWGQALAPNGYSAVSLNTALVLDWLLTHCADGAWHAISTRQLGAAVGISSASVSKALHNLEAWELIRRETDGQRCSRIRVLAGRVRQALRHAGLELPTSTSAMLN